MTGFLNLTVREIGAVLMSAAMLFVLVLLNDRELVGEHVNTPRRNGLSNGGVIVLRIVYKARAAYRPCSPKRCERGMINPDNVFEEVGHSRGAFDLTTAGSMRPRHRRAPHDAVAVTRVALRPCQQTVFWGRRLCVAATLVVMAIGPALIAAGK
jgi:hypothetical protein